MQETPHNKRKALITFVAVLIMVVVIVGAVAASPKKQSEVTSADTPAAAADTSTKTTTEPTPVPETPTATAQPTPIPTPAPLVTTPSSGYKDGSYSATGSYLSPGGNEHITIKVTIKDGVITDTSAIGGAQDREAEEYQSDFIGGYKPLVVGKNIASVKLSRVSGASLTPKGFNNAISQIKLQAKA